MKPILSTLILALALCASAQTVYKPVTIPLPFTTLAAATSTNLASGWTSTTTSTNTTVIFDASSAAFVTNNVITTNTSTAYANFDAQGQQNVALQFEWNASGATSTNVDITIARSVTGVNYDTCNNQTFSFAHNGTTGICGVTNISMNGFGYGRIVTFFNRDTTAILTNKGIAYGSYAGARRP